MYTYHIIYIYIYILLFRQPGEVVYQCECCTRRDDDNNNYYYETDIMFVQLMILLLLLCVRVCVCISPADDRDGGGIFPRGSDQKKPASAAVVPGAVYCARLEGGLSRVRRARCFNLRRSDMNIIL